MAPEVQQKSERLARPVSGSGAVGVSAEMLEVAEDACRAGNFALAADIYESQLADLPQPDRGLCLRRADALARCGRISEAVDSFCAAAKIRALQPDELKNLVENIAQTLKEKDLTTCGVGESHQKDLRGSCKDSGKELDGNEHLDLFTCRLCKFLLSEPSTLQCGHTFCKRCLEESAVYDCVCCKQKTKSNGKTQQYVFRSNVVLCGLLDKWFAVESKARRLWMQGENQRKELDFLSALEKYSQAVELAPSMCELLLQRAELLLLLGRVSQALQDTDSACRQRPLWPEAHYAKAIALNESDRQEEALQEYLLCVALKPDWATAKMEAQKLLSRMFSSLFEGQGSVMSAFPPQADPSQRFKPAQLLDTRHTQENEQRDCIEKAVSAEGSRGEGTKTMGSILSALPAPPGLKRKHSFDMSAMDRPAKLLKTDSGGSSCTPVACCTTRQVPPHLLDSSDMECSLCMRVFYEPVATPCGHTFCLKCLERCLDHNPCCPLCKEDLSEYLATRAYSKTVLMEEVLKRYLKEELDERKKIHEDEMRELGNLNQEVPIFICTMAFPTIPCPLHVHEPRYRLMIRRSMETGTKQFGMCIADSLKGFADFGCILEVQDVKVFPDGRSIVDTIGVSRFRVLSHGQRDGYHTAKIEYLKDQKADGEELADLLKLHDSVYEQARTWFSSLKNNLKNQILGHFGQLPSIDPDPQASCNGPAWCWWLLAVLPLESKAQLTILAMTSLKERLGAIRRILLYVTRRRQKCSQHETSSAS